MADEEASPLLRGSLKSEDGFITYKGKWAFGKEGHAANDTGKFELKSITAAHLPGDTDVEIVFEGFFVLKKAEDKKVKIKEEAVKLLFSKDSESSNLNVSGTGKNKLGDYQLSGTYFPDMKKMSLEKSYKDEDDDEFSGSDDGEDSDNDEDGDGELDENDIADELADLKADQEEHGLVIEEDAEADKEKTSRLKKRGGKKIVVKRASSDDGDGGPSEESSKKKIKRSSDEKVSVTLPVPSSSWKELDLKATHERLNKMVELNDPLGISMMLKDLSAHKITIELLQSTGIGKDVRGLKKHSDPEVSSVAEALVNMWKGMVKQENEGE